MTQVTVHATLKIAAAGDIGDGSQVICFGARLDGDERELRYLSTQFDNDDLWITKRDEGTWMAYTTRFVGRTDWAEIHAEFEELIAVLSALLSLLRFSHKRLTCNSLNWYGPNQTHGFIGLLPATAYVTMSTDTHVILPDVQP